MYDDWVKHKHGVEGYESSTGSHFGRYVDDALHPGQQRFESNLPVFVPRVCCDCRHFDSGEAGEYGELLSGPYCTANVWFPTKTGRCKVKEAGSLAALNARAKERT